MNELIFRRANQDDDLEKIASLIYNTDQYIYPFWFETEEKCKQELPKLIVQEKFFFYYEHLYLALNKDNEILGLICIVDKNANLEYNYTELKETNDRYKFTIENYIAGLIDEVKNAPFAYISNVCVDEAYRNLHVGTFLMKNVVEEYKNKKYDEIVLDVLADNPSAIHLYEKMGFEKKGDNFEGFNDPEKEKPSVFTMQNTIESNDLQ